VPDFAPLNPGYNSVKHIRRCPIVMSPVLHGRIDLTKIGVAAKVV